MRNTKGSILAITVGFALVFTMLGVASIHMSTLQNETQTKQILSQKAFWLAEAGAAHASSELRRRIETDLRAAVENDNPNNVNTLMVSYFNSQASTGLLSHYVNLQFPGGQNVWHVVSADSLDLGDGIQGSYDAKITITPKLGAQNPSISGTNAYTFSYVFLIESNATLNIGTQKIIKLNNPNYSVTVQRDNFAKYALFTNHHSMPDVGTVWFTANTSFNGPMHTNDRFSFANNPSGNFTGEVTQHEITARFYNNGSPVLLDADRNGNRDVPVFHSGFKRGQPVIIIPATTSQQYMKTKALGGDNPTANGIYLPNDGTNVTGGIFIKGNSTVNTVNMAVAGQNPVYTITQGATTRTVTVNYSNNTTTISGDPKTYLGIPDGQGQTGGGALIYSTDPISSFSGTVQKNSTVTVASEVDLVITNNILYENPPTSVNPNPTNLLGIISWNGDVRIGTSAPNNITIHGVVMAPNGVFTVDNYNSGSYRGVATLLGGAITDSYGAFGTFSGNTNSTGYGRNFIYDGRMLQGVSPLYFPFMPNFTAISNGIGSGLIWQEG
jgi:Tfp pilus assembly protein PilX